MISSLISHYGLLALGGLILLESLGLPLPGETVLLIAAAAAAQHLLPIGTVIAVAALAAIGGGTLGYAAGRRYGFTLLSRYGAWIGITPARIAQAQAFFERHGAPTVFFGRFVTLLRMLAAVLAGASRMPAGKFLRYNALGAMLWATLVGGLGYAFGRQLPLLERWMSRLGWGTMLILTLMTLIAVARASLRRKSQSDSQR